MNGYDHLAIATAACFKANLKDGRYGKHTQIGICGGDERARTTLAEKVEELLGHKVFVHCAEECEWGSENTLLIDLGIDYYKFLEN